MIDGIKKIGELASIDEPIRKTFYKNGKRIDVILSKFQFFGTHTGRRTFICNALVLGIPLQVVMKWTRYKNMKQ